MPIAARHRQPSLRYSDRDLARFGLTCVPGQPTAVGRLPAPRAAVGRDRRLAEAEFCPYIRAGFCYYYDNIRVYNIPRSNPMKRRPVPSPAIPLIARFGPRDRRKMPPVGPRREAAYKYLIYTALSRMTGSNLSAESMIRPVSPLLQGSAKCWRALPCQRWRRSTSRHRPITSRRLEHRADNTKAAETSRIMLSVRPSV
jgi:hypothetical protein